MVSISSKKIIHGEIYQAFSKISQIFFSDSPTYLSSISGLLIEIKFIWDSVASALANIVFEQPGGPYSKMPFVGLRPL